MAALPLGYMTGGVHMSLLVGLGSVVSCLMQRILTSREARPTRGVEILVALILLVPTGDSVAQPSSHALTIEDVLSMRRAKTVTFSPDGKHVVAVIEEPNTATSSRGPMNNELWLLSVDGESSKRLTDYPGPDSEPRWSPKGRYLAFLSDRSGQGNQIHLLEWSTNKVTLLTRHPTSLSSFTWSPTGDEIAYLAPLPVSEEENSRGQLGWDAIEVPLSGRDRTSPPQRIWIVELASQKAREINVGAWHISSLQWSHRGEFLIVGVPEPNPDLQNLKPQLMTMSVTGGQPEPYCQVPGHISRATWSPNGRSVAFLGVSGEGPDAFPGILYICSSQGERPRPLNLRAPFTIQSYQWMPDGESLLIAVSHRVYQYLGRISVGGGEIQRLTPSGFNLPTRTDVSISGNGEMLSCLLTSGNHPADVWVGPVTGRLRQLTRLNPRLEERSYGATEEFKWQARDGLEITGLLIRPVGYEEGRRYPLVVQIHGSQIMDIDEFQASWMNWGQILASRGFAVLLPNYRGSLGRSAQFARANHGDLGGRDLEDILDGVDVLVAHGLADPERLGIGGVSYGGFLTAWAITQTQRFKAAVMGLGISNWVSMAGLTPGPKSMLSIYWGGHFPYQRDSLLWRRSPIASVGKVNTPTLIFAGENDPFVPVSQSREFFRGLRYFGVPSQMVVYPREGHSIRERNHLKDLFERIVSWYERYLASGPQVKAGD